MMHDSQDRQNDPAELRPVHRELPPGLPAVLPVQEAPAPGEQRGYVRMAVMDGKTISHRVCITQVKGIITY